ncbi:hypothetical protein V2J09_006878 [Rumex salicifolius]
MEKENNIKKPEETKEKRFAFRMFICLRVLAAGASMASACFMLTNNQTAEIFGIQMVAKYSYASAFKFMAFANMVVSGFALFSLFASLFFSGKGLTPNCYFLFFLHDLAVTAVELAACAAATAVGFVGRYGNPHAGWMPICDHFESFCERGTVSVALSYMAFIFFLCLTIVSASSSRNININIDRSFSTV